ncbi:MAG TPA: carboxy terminal-processing peptidase [Opitutaceae bacterium]|nr:carboxy terminal-processing peptidase [Opitutaceae bacterium]
MIRVPGFIRRLACFSAALLAFSPVFAADRKPFSTSSTLQSEASTLIKLLEQAHYNHENVRSSDYANVVSDYMGDLDGQRLFFLGTDKAKFMDDYGQKIYYNLAFLGNLEAAGAYEMFYVYQQRVESRIAWIFAELKKDFDLTSKETYRADRSKAEWPANSATADDLWRKRLKFEIVAELLNKKSADEAKTIVRKRYERMLKNLGEIEGNDLAELFLSTVARLYDPHSTYFSAATYEDFGIQMKLQLVGIGALLGLEDDVCIVKEIVPGGPADIGRILKPNDKIISVAQTGAEPVEIIGMKLRKIVDMIRGQKGTQVHLTVQPADATDASARRQVVITRDTVKLNSARARAAIFQLPQADGKTQPLGVITLPGFYGPADDGDTDAEKTTAAKDVARLIEQLKKEGIQGLVLDLRHNGGGYLTEAIELAGLFIQQGPVVQVRSYNGEIQVDRDSNPRIAYEGPLAVLVDRFSASASEIVAGALQNYGRAIVIGDSSTHGKGSVQQVVEMKQLSRALAFSPVKTGAAKFTIQKYYLPSGASTQLKGVVPDISLPAINDYLPIGESDLPRALVWDQIPTSSFDGGPLDPKVVTPLKQSSLERQAKLEEFAYLRKNVEWFKSRQEQKLISINLEERQKQKADDDAFRKEMKAEKERLAKNDFAFKPFYLGPPPVPKIKAVKKESEKTDEDDIEAETEENETYVKADVHLRETLRVVSDAIALGRNRDLWAANRAPLTAVTRGG